MKYDNLSKDELVTRIEELEHDLINYKSNNERLTNVEDLAKQQSSILKFINSMAIPSADKSTVDEFSKTLIKAVKEYTGAVLAVFSLYQPDKKELLLLHIEAEQGMLKKALKIAGDKIVRTASPVDDETYKLIIKNHVYKYNTFTEVSFGAIPKLIDKAIRASTGIDRLYPIAHLIEGELYGTTLLAFKKGQTSPSIELLESYAHLMSVSLRRYKAEKALQDSEIKYRTYIESAPLGIIIADDKGKYIDVNPGASDLLGYTRDELLELSIPDVLADEKNIDSFQKLKEEGKLNHENKLKKKDGSIVDVRLDAVLLPNNQFIAFHTDITKRKKAEAALTESEESFREMFNNMGDGACRYKVIDEGNDFIFVDINKAGEKIAKVKKTDILGKSIFEIRSNTGKYGLTDIFKRVWNTGKSETYNESFYQDEDLSGYFKNYVYKLSSGDIVAIFEDLTENKLAQEALVKSKEKAEENEIKFKAAFYTSPDSVNINKLNGEFVEINEGFTRLTGYTEDDVIGKLSSEINIWPIPGERDKLISALQEFGFIENLETKFKTKDGRLIPALLSAKIITIKDEPHILSVTKAISELKKFEQELITAKEKAEESKANITAIIEGTNDSIWAFNRSYELLYINNTFQQEFLKSFGVLLKTGMNLVEALPESLQPFWKPRYDRVLNNEQYTLEDAVPTENGTLYIEVTFNPIVKKGLVIGGSCFGNNITSRKLAEIELQKAKEKAEESERKLIEAQELSHVGSWDYFTETDTVTWSKELFNIFERSYDLPAPKYSEQRKFYTEESFAVLDKAIQDCVQREIPYEIELDIITASGSVKQIISTGKVKKDIKNKVIGSYGTAQDITQKKKTEKELIKAKEKAEESDRLKSAFLANMSHEIRTPMNGILGFTNLLKEPGLKGETQQKFIEIIEKSGNRMLSTVNDIIDISKIEAGQVDVVLSEFNLNKQLDELLEFFLPEAKKKNIQLSITSRVPDQQAKFTSDKEKLNSILTNFIKNAIKYTTKGSIEFGYSINKKATQNELEFFVKDTGIGISKERKEAVFGRFIQADIEDKQAYEGSGLGLAISKAYVEMLGGKIWVESQIGVGSQFYFTIPYETENKEISNQNTEDSNKLDLVEKRLKILIAEDDETAITYLSIILKEYAKEILIAQTGIEAVKICRENLDIDIVLMDIKIPGIDGYQATQQIREFNKDIFIVAQTAYAQSGDREKAIEAGCNDYISKPIKQESLLEIISSQI